MYHSVHFHFTHTCCHPYSQPVMHPSTHLSICLYNLWGDHISRHTCSISSSNWKRRQPVNVDDNRSVIYILCPIRAIRYRATEPPNIRGGRFDRFVSSYRNRALGVQIKIYFQHICSGLTKIQLRLPLYVSTRHKLHWLFRTSQLS